ncbi:nitrate/nitrite transporter NrtS [Vibrio sp. NTOU-M3]|uniref:nitrate/nitrite transporter NrtS n=1 Tax=unclassified Vibrio TaxID=2614977 RepID=UPI00349F78D6
MNSTSIKRALVIAIIVGSLLNLINQYDALFMMAQFNGYKAVLTYFVPFGVSLISSWLAEKDVTKQQ